MASHPDSVAFAGKTNPGRQVTSIVLRRPNSICGYFNGCEPKPLRARCAVDIPVQSGMVHQDLKSASDQQDDRIVYLEEISSRTIPNAAE